jgi:putative glutamine amidotransferase
LLPAPLGCYDPFLMRAESPAKPRIGVPFRTKKEQVAGDRSKIQRYLKAVQLAGGDPIAVPLDLSTPELKKLAASLDGVALSGSPADVDPALFHAPPHPKAASPDHERERTDFNLLDHFFTGQKPVLAICYGIQSLNVFLGGSLVQDIPSELGSRVQHDVESDYGTPETFHKVRLEAGSRVMDLANGLDEVNVNSSHHQSVLQPGRGMLVTAKAADGVIEAMESTSRGHWVTAVQWHPERMVETDAFALSLFRGLVAAARRTPAPAQVRRCKQSALP